MKKYNCYCEICGLTLKYGQNSLSNHIYNSHKDITKEQYYALYVSNNNTCRCCGSATKFINLQKGYSQYCSQSCSTKDLQWNTEAGELRKEKLSESMAGNTFSNGRPIGSKNINPYPIDSPKVQQRIKNLTEYLHTINHWHNINVNWWNNAPEEAQRNRINNWINKDIQTESDCGKNNITINELGKQRLNKIFDIE